MIDRALIAAILRQYGLPWNGIHGIAHWARVMENGLRLIDWTGANPKVVALFAVFHDSQRINEQEDPDHGVRGAALAASLRGKFFELSDAEFDLLQIACCDHPKGQTQGEITVQTCWDADRLDLGRVGRRPDPRSLCTAAGRDSEMLEWAERRARRGIVPSLVVDLWGINLRMEGPADHQ